MCPITETSRKYTQVKIFLLRLFAVIIVIMTVHAKCSPTRLSLSILIQFTLLINLSQASLSPASTVSSSASVVTSSNNPSSHPKGEGGSAFRTDYLQSTPSKKEHLTPAELLADVDRVFPSNYDSLQPPSKLFDIYICIYICILFKVDFTKSVPLRSLKSK